MSDKQHLSLLICEYKDDDKRSISGRLAFELGGIDKRTMEKLEKEAALHNMDPYTFSIRFNENDHIRGVGYFFMCSRSFN